MEKPPVPEKFKSLKPLMDLAHWTDLNLGSRLILTGTAHAKFEMEYMEDSFKPDSVVFVGPLSELVFSKLLMRTGNLNLANVDEIVRITNRVPRELMKLSAFIEENSISIDEALTKFEVNRTGYFQDIAEKYYNEIKGDDMA
ncbi:hypothetical protein BGX21_007930, partial [Mortierella sp. AD011]